MAISQSSPTNKSPLSSKWKQKKTMIKKKAADEKQRVKKVSFDLASNTIVRYDPKSAFLFQTRDSKAELAAIERANEVQASLPSEIPSLVNHMLPSHVTGGFWLGLPVEIVDRKEKQLRNKSIPLVKVVWKQRKRSRVTWEVVDEMCKLYPTLFA